MGDTRKQYQLATAIAQRLRDDKDTSLASSAIVEALKGFIHTLQSTSTGRFPTQVEAVYDAVSLAVSSSPAVSLNQVNRELGIGVEHLRLEHIRRVR